MNSSEMQSRGQSHTTLRNELDRHGPAILHQAERDLLLDTADALLFSEPDASTKLENARSLLSQLQQRSSWTDDMVQRVREALEGCGDSPVLA